jgi:hypothetical protein
MYDVFDDRTNAPEEDRSAASGLSDGRHSGDGGLVMRRSVDLSRLLSSDAVSQTRLADHSGVILDIDSLRVFSVNPTGMCLVEALRDGIDDHEGLVHRVIEEFDVDRDTAAKDVDAFVEELARYLVDRRV